MRPPVRVVAPKTMYSVSACIITELERNLFIFTLLVFFFVKCPLRIVWLTLPKGVCEEPFIEVILNHFGTFLCWRDSMFFNYIYQPAITGEKNSGMVHLYRCARPYMVQERFRPCVCCLVSCVWINFCNSSANVFRKCLKQNIPISFHSCCVR